jgi:hypothetical protein
LHHPGRGPVPQPALAVVLLGAVQREQHRQGPGPLRGRKVDQHGTEKSSFLSIVALCCCKRLD